MDRAGRAGKQSLGIKAYRVQKKTPRTQSQREKKKSAFCQKPLSLIETQNLHRITEEGLSALPGETGRGFKA
jgi:hypothetical protein